MRVPILSAVRGICGIQLGPTIRMSSSIASSSSAFDPLVQQIVDRLDRNKDGQITRAEFGDFLTAVVTQFRRAGGATSDITAGASWTTRAADETADDFPPSTWTDNNAPYGVTLAGFCPQNHRDLTLADLGVPGKAEKYAVYHYLVTNQVEPTSDWAPAAAEALNKRYSTTVYKAIDGETLGFGTEYVHSAPNGYGMRAGTYDPTARGEFFWGTTE